MRAPIAILLLSAAALAAQPKPGPADEAARHYKLSMEKVDRWAAANKAVFDYVRTHPGFAQKAGQMETLGQAGSLEEMDQRARSIAPEYVKAVESSGLNFRDYVVATIALSAAYATAGAAQPPKTIPAANIAFVRANKPKLDAIFAQLQQMSAAVNKKPGG